MKNNIKKYANRAGMLGVATDLFTIFCMVLIMAEEHFVKGEGSFWKMMIILVTLRVFYDEGKS